MEPDRSSMEYWRGRVEQRGSRFSVRIQDPKSRQRLRFSLGDDQDDAARRALAIWRTIEADGWGVAVKTFGSTRRKAPNQQLPHATITAYLEAFRRYSEVSELTFTGYSGSLRRIVKAAMDIPDDPGSLQLREIDDARVEEWKVASHREALAMGVDEGRRAATSITSDLAKIRSLFKADAAAKISREMRLPDPLPFSTVKGFSKRHRSRTTYTSKIDARQLAIRAVSLWGPDGSEWSHENEQILKMFLLALWTGLRRREIDTLLQRQVDLDHRLIDLEDNPYYQGKSAEARGTTNLHPVFAEQLRIYLARTEGEFVIQCKGEIRIDPSRPHYRCEPLWQRLLAWLRQQGVDAHRPVHTLRKEFATWLLREGADAEHVRRQLRQADAAVAREHYIDAESSVVVDQFDVFSNTTNDDHST